jgi:hypothetical protein
MMGRCSLLRGFGYVWMAICVLILYPSVVGLYWVMQFREGETDALRDTHHLLYMNSGEI